MELTQIFMIPLVFLISLKAQPSTLNYSPLNLKERYFSSLMPLHKNISPFKSVPKLKEFDAEEFIRNLKQAGPELTPTLKGDLPGLYRSIFLSQFQFQ